MAITEDITIRRGRRDEVACFQAIDKSARVRYASLAGFEFVAEAPPVGADRFDAGETWARETGGIVAGFILLQPHGDTAYLANISVVPEAGARGVGMRLIARAMLRAKENGASAVTLTTFRAPPWNGSWFRRQGFSAIPENRIGPMLRTIIERQSASLDASTRETLWRGTK